MDEARVVVTGANGQLGTAFRKVVPKAIFLDRSQLDLSTPERVAEILAALNPSAIINCAAYTAVDKAEAEEALATRVNGSSVGEMAGVATDLGIPFVTFSTDYVFNGSKQGAYVESDPVDPIGAYGRSKLVGERLAIEHNPGSLVIRTSWVVSETHNNFIATMLRLGSAEDAIVKVVDDQRGRVTMASDLAVGAWAALQAGATGIVHMANQGEATWFEVARYAVGTAGYSEDRIVPCSTSEYPTPAKRPANSVLRSERIAGLGLAELPPWKDAMPRLVERQLIRLQRSA